MQTDLPEIGALAASAFADSPPQEAVEAVITIRRSDAPEPSQPPSATERVICLQHDLVYRYGTDQRYRMRYANFAAGTLDFATRRAEWRVWQPPTARAVLHRLLLDPLALLLARSQVLFLHGAAVRQREAGATLLLGGSGQGKSTLAFLLAHARPERGIFCLCDDTLALDFSQRPVRAFPIHDGFGLSPELLRQFGISTAGAAAVHWSGKVYVADVPRRASGPCVVNRLLFLNLLPASEAEGQVRLLNRSECLRALLGLQITMPHPYLRERLQMCHCLAEQAEALQISYYGRCDVDLIYATLASP